MGAGMAVFGLVFLVALLVLVGTALAIGLVAAAVGVILLAMGVVSSSVFVGLRRGRPAGVRFFLIQCGVWIGMPAGAIVAWCMQSLFNGFAIGWPVLLYGAAGGALAGCFAALLFDAFATRTGRTATE